MSSGIEKLQQNAKSMKENIAGLSREKDPTISVPTKRDGAWSSSFQPSTMFAASVG